MTTFSLHHVQLAVPAGNEQACRAFWGDLLGLTELDKPAVLATRGGCWFRAGGLEVHLGRSATGSSCCSRTDRQRPRSTTATPPSVATEATTSRTVTCSDSSSTPPTAASTGTLSCTVDAVTARSDGSTAYQAT